MPDSDCPCCGEPMERWSPLWSRSAWYHRCGSCGLTWCKERPGPETGDYTQDELRDAKNRLSIEDYLKKISPLLPQGPFRWLELGGAYGHLTWEVQRRYGAEVFMVEPGATGRGYAQECLGLRAYPDIQSLGQAVTGGFDVIFSGHVWEHVDDPLGFVQESFALLNDGGVWMAITPNADSWKHRLFRGGWCWLSPDHLQILSPLSAAGFLRRAGLDPVHIKDFQPAAIDYPGVLIGGVSFCKEWLKSRQGRKIKGSKCRTQATLAPRKPGRIKWLVTTFFGGLVRFSLFERRFWSTLDREHGADEFLIGARKINPNL